MAHVGSLLKYTRTAYCCMHLFTCMTLHKLATLHIMTMWVFSWVFLYLEHLASLAHLGGDKWVNKLGQRRMHMIYL